MKVTEDFTVETSVSRACNAVNISRSTFYRRRKAKEALVVKKERKPGSGLARALSEEEREKILSVLHSEKYIDKSPRQIYASLLDEGVGLGHNLNVTKLVMN